MAILQHPTPTNKPKKHGPEIVNFRPVPCFVAALANRRLQPLGHLTADCQHAARKHLPDCTFFPQQGDGSNARSTSLAITGGLM